MKMEPSNNCFEQIENILNLDYLFKKCSWYIKRNVICCGRLCKYIEQIIELHTTSLVSFNVLRCIKIYVPVLYLYFSLLTENKLKI